MELADSVLTGALEVSQYTLDEAVRSASAWSTFCEFPRNLPKKRGICLLDWNGISFTRNFVFGSISSQIVAPYHLERPETGCVITGWQEGVLP